MNSITTPEAQAIASAFTRGNPIKPSYKTMEETLRQWHQDSLNDPEFMWLSISFEQMADAVNKAVFCTGDDAPKWGDLPGFGNVRAELDALTVRRSA